MSLSTILELTLVLTLTLAVPILSFQTARRPEIKLLPRLQLYISAALSQWLLTLIGLAVVLASSLRFSDLGFRGAGWVHSLAWAAGLALAALVALGLLVWLENRDWWPAEPELVYRLIPRTNREKLWAVLVIAPTAALCEEFLYRGFLLSVLSHWFHSVEWGWALSSVAFGFAHTYQGASGTIRVMIMGALLAYPAVHLGSLYPSIAAHFLIDAVALVWLGPRFLGPPAQPQEGPQGTV